MRAPMLLCGLAALVVLPLLLSAEIGWSEGVICGWLLAVAPLHVYFSRYARPYAVTMLLASVAGLAFFRWWSGAERRWAVTYAACAIGAVYLHLPAVPIVVAPLL